MAVRTRKDWAGETYQENLDMAKRMIDTLDKEIEDAEGKKMTVAKFLGVPDGEVTTLVNDWDGANRALEQAKLAGRGDTAANAAVKATFPPLVKQMRRVKNGWIHVPPATAQILAFFGFSERDKNTTYGEPSGVDAAEVVKRDRALLVVRFVNVGGDPHDPANKNRRLWYKLVEPGEKPPLSPEELTKSVPANRKTETLKFGYGDSGKMVYIAVQYENGKLKGQFGPMIAVLIP